MKWILERLSEKGTLTVIVGVVVSVLTLLGLEVDADTQLKVQTAIAGVTGLLVAIFKEKTVG